MQAMSEQDTVSFGFKEVTPDEKVDRVKGVFRSVASKYDVMNDFMSAGVHRLWKHDTMNRVNPQPGERHLDVAGGTGELARAFLSLADEAGKRRGDTRQATAIVCDINDAMLEVGKARGDLIIVDHLPRVGGEGGKHRTQKRYGDPAGY